MGWPVCNSTTEEQSSAFPSTPPDLSPNAQLTGIIIIVNEVPLWDGGITFHQMALIVGGAFAIVAGIVSFYIIMGHATHYSKPLEQRQ